MGVECVVVAVRLVRRLLIGRAGAPRCGCCGFGHGVNLVEMMDLEKTASPSKGLVFYARPVRLQKLPLAGRRGETDGNGHGRISWRAFVACSKAAAQCTARRLFAFGQNNDVVKGAA